MGIISLEKSGQLFWMGRYVERVFTTLKLFQVYYDQMIDGTGEEYQTLCDRLGIPNIYRSQEDFVKSYLFGKENPNSLVSNIRRAYDNAIMLRDEISSDTLAYIQMAVDTLENGGDSEAAAPMLLLQKIIDDIYAFWGCADDSIDDENSRNIIKVGRSAERIDLYIRLDIHPARTKKEFEKLINRLYKVHMDYDSKALGFLANMILEKGNWEYRANEMLDAVNNLFLRI